MPGTWAAERHSWWAPSPASRRGPLAVASCDWVPSATWRNHEKRPPLLAFRSATGLLPGVTPGAKRATMHNLEGQKVPSHETGGARALRAATAMNCASRDGSSLASGKPRRWAPRPGERHECAPVTRLESSIRLVGPSSWWPPNEQRFQHPNVHRRRCRDSDAQPGWLITLRGCERGPTSTPSPHLPEQTSRPVAPAMYRWGLCSGGRPVEVAVQKVGLSCGLLQIGVIPIASHSPSWLEAGGV